ncbi:MAG: hypothetical protein V1763_01760 [Parcubacteria group bacterium]
MMEKLAIGDKVAITEQGKKIVAEVTDINGDAVQFLTATGKTLFMQLKKTRKGWTLAPATHVVEMTTLRA